MREKIDPQDRLSDVLSMKVTAKEKIAWLEKAQAAGMTSSAYFRVSVLEARTTVVALPRNDLEAVRFLHLYVRVTNAVETLVGQAVFAVQRGTLPRQDYLALLSQLGGVVLLFREGLRRAD